MDYLKYSAPSLFHVCLIKYLIDSCDWQVLDEYQKKFGDSWRTAQQDSTQTWPYLGEALTKFQVCLLICCCPRLFIWSHKATYG